MALNELTQESFARAVGVEIRRVNEVSARLAIGLIHFLRFSLGGPPSPFLAKGHRAESRFGDPKPALAEQSVFHNRAPFIRVYGAIEFRSDLPLFQSL